MAKLTVTLSATGLGESVSVVESFAEAMMVCLSFIEARGVPESAWTGGDVRTRSGRLMCRVSHSGRLVWTSGAPIRIP